MNTEVTNKDNSSTIRIILHVGNGLETYTQGLPPVKAEKAVGDMAVKLGGEYTGLNSNRVVLFPEVMTTEVAAVRFVFDDFRTMANDEATLFSVVTFNTAVLNSMLSAFIDLGLAESLAVCLHRENEQKGHTFHTLDKELFLNDWPYGVLDSALNRHDLREMGFEPKLSKIT